MRFDAKVFGAKIRARRAELDISQAELSKKTGISVSTIVSYESGDGYVPKTERLLCLASALDCSPNYLVGWVDE